MSITYTSAAVRASRQTHASHLELTWPDGLLAAASIVSAVAIALGMIGASARGTAVSEGAPVVNLNAVADVRALEPALAAAISDAGQRRAAAHHLVQFISRERERRGGLPNVGALARARVESDSPEAAVPVLTSSQLAQLKPRVIVRTREAFRNQVLLFGAVYLLAFHSVAWVWRRRGIRYDRLVLVVAHLLTGIGLATVLSLPDPLRDTFLMGRYTEGILLGLALMTAVSLLNFQSAAFLDMSYVPLLAALSLSVLLLVFGTGPTGSGAKVNLGPVQPIEAIRLLLALFLAGYFARRWELLRSARQASIRHMRLPAWIDVPRLEYVLPVAAGVGVALFFFALQKDLGPALYTSCVFLAVYAVARARAAMALCGLAVLVLGFYVGHVLGVSQTLVNRVAMWRLPWDNQVGGGDQIAHALWAMATGAVSGTGLGLGDTRYLPAGHTDLILAAVGEELGAIGLMLIVVLYALLAWRGLRIGRFAHTDYGFLLAFTMTLFLVVPAVIMASGVVGAAPLTGVVTPFLSYGGSAMVINFVALGVLQSIHGARGRRIDSAPFKAPTGWVGGVLSAAALGFCAIVADVQIIHADDYAVKPHLGVQADGVRRFSYNPRVLDVVRDLPRGTVYDRRGLPLATSDAGVAARAREKFAALGISIADLCGAAEQRCYPLGGRAFHLLGDARSRANFSAANTSYVEQDAEGTLRGFDDHATTVHGALRRDYAEVVPLLRGGDREVAAFRNRPRDVRLTIDAGLQVRAASIVASYAQRSGGTGAAAVVLDPDTGEVLASVSYPWPDEVLASGVAPGPQDPAYIKRADPVYMDRADPAYMDRARYGLYPPGSTFKLVTASAALREHAGLQRTTLACSRLPDGRVGAKIAGWSRPIRDDVLDSQPHGSIDLHEGLVRSCNAYFAQLAVKLGPEPLRAVAAQLGIPLVRAGGDNRRVADTLPQIGYGQGDVLATPLRMARVAAAIASDGRLRDVFWTAGSKPAPPVVFLDTPSAQLLARYMRDAVREGTGRRLREHPFRIAGKTGTAEVAGKPSHSWFVGFAPYGPTTKRIAFAVVIENAGYGSANAAPAAGEIVSAAAAAGLLK